MENEHDISQYSEDYQQGMINGVAFATMLLKNILMEQGVLRDPQSALFKPGVLVFTAEDGSLNPFDLQDLMNKQISEASNG
jgi:hypothetical protein